MIDYGKVKQFIQNLTYAKSDIGLCAKNIRDLCEQIFGDEQSLTEEIGNYKLEKNANKKSDMIEGLKTLAAYYKDDLRLLREELNKYNSFIADIATSRIKIPEYKDERGLVLANVQELMSDFEYVYGNLIEKLQIFINEPINENLESIHDAMINKMSIDDLNLKVEKNLDAMTQQLDEMRTKTEKFASMNTVRR